MTPDPTLQVAEQRQSRPTIAVVIPAFNAAWTVTAAIRSVLEQTDGADEIIVVDDGSSDDTAAVVEGFGPQVVLLRQQNQGAAVARQTGTQAATCEYIAYLDADDWWPQQRLAVCRKILTCEAVDFMLGDLQRARPGAGPDDYLPRNSEFYPWARRWFDGNQAGSVDKLFRLEPEAGLALLLRGFPVYPSTILVRRSVVDGVGGWDARFRRSQDFDIGLRIARRFPLHYIDDVQAILGLHDVNADELSYAVMQTQGDIQVLQAHCANPGASPRYRRLAARALARKYCALGFIQSKRGQLHAASASYRRAMRWPGRRGHALLRWALYACLAAMGTRAAEKPAPDRR